MIKESVCLILHRISNDMFKECVITSVLVINIMSMLQQCMAWYVVTEWSAVSSTIPCYVAAEFSLQLGLRFCEQKAHNFTWYFQKSLQQYR